MLKDQDTMQLRLSAILGCKLVYKRTHYVYLLKTLDEAIELYKYLESIKTNKIDSYTINKADIEDERSYKLSIYIEHMIKNS